MEISKTMVQVNSYKTPQTDRQVSSRKNPLAAYEARLSGLKDKDLFRTLKSMNKRQDKTIYMAQKPFLNLSSNDYLGLATHEPLVDEFYNALDDDTRVNRYGLGSSSSRLLTGNFALYEELETLVENLYGAPALVFNSGYHGNIGIIPALTGKQDLILSDSLNHASIVDGVRLSRATYMVFEHNRLDELERILAARRDQYENVLIITESVFSMDGDLADITGLVEIKNRYGALLYVDEAHSVGLYGAEGLGLCHELGVRDQVDILLCPMGKALASHGAFAVTCDTLKQVLINQMRSLLYTTALPPVAVNWNRFVMERLALFSKRRAHLQEVSAAFRRMLDQRGIAYTGESHIVPVLVGPSDLAVELATHLRDKGFLVFPIRWPTVAHDQARIRISLTSDITAEDLVPVPDMIQTFLESRNICRESAV